MAKPAAAFGIAGQRPIPQAGGMTPHPTGARFGRRRFIRLAAGAGAAAALAPVLAAAEERRRPFEVSASLYAWELHDEGVERVLDNLQGMAAVNSVYLIGVMHPERRPFGRGDFPHNPVRKTWQAEDARCYWHPDPARYGRVQPRLSGYAWLNQTDWLQVLAEAARRRGLRVGCELSHALIDRERMAGECADLAQRTVADQPAPAGAVSWLRPPCPNHPETLRYAVGLATDAAASARLDYLQSCIINFDPAPPERGGGCFCSHCREAAGRDGIDLARVQARLRATPQAAEALSQWRDFRRQSVVRFYAALRGGLAAARPGVDLRYNIHSRAYAGFGIDLPLLRAQVDSMRIMDYTEQEGDPSKMPEKRAWLTDIRRQVGPDLPLVSAVAVRLKATPELVQQGVGIAAATGMQGVALGHYDGATFPMLRGIRAGLAEAGLVRSA